MTPDPTPRPLLDHGYIAYVDSWGSDHRIIQAARMSTSKGFLGWERETVWVCGTCKYSLTNNYEPWVGHVINCPNNCGLLEIDKAKSHAGDLKLLKYLYEHHHMTPFEMAGMAVEVQAPIFVFREWHRHRTQSYNELSARYTPLPDLNYVPTVERLLIPGGNNKQAIGLDGKVLDEYNAIVWNQELKDAYENVQRVYQCGLDLGVPKELARLPVSVGRYSRMMASANLRNWLQFLTLRMDEAAQYEIRVYAHAVAELIQEKFPRTYELFDKERHV